MDSVNTEVKIEYVRTEKTVKTGQDYRGREDVQNTTKILSFKRQGNQVKQDHHEDI